MGETSESWAGTYQVHMNVAEPACRYQYVLKRYLYVAVYLGPLAVHTGLRLGGDLSREAFPHIPRDNEAARGPDAWVSGAVQVVKDLPAEVSGDQGLKLPHDGVAKEVKVANLLSGNAQLGAGAEGLYLWTKDLAECHVTKVEESLVGDGCVAEGRCGYGNTGGRAGQCVRYHVGHTWHVHEVGGVLGD